MAITVNDKDLGMVTAYAYALAGGYTGTEAEFEALLGNIAKDLAEIENLSVQVQTLPAGSDATASYAEGVLTLGIPRGDKGETGDQGEIGPTPQLSVGTVTTGEPGTDAEVEITGTPEAPVLNFTLPRGDTGNITQAVRYDAAQTLTDVEKEQARANIDAANAALSGHVDRIKADLVGLQYAVLAYSMTTDAKIDKNAADVAASIAGLLADVSGAEAQLEKIPAMFAAVEETGTASENHAAGSLLVLDDVLYIVTSAISPGETIAPGTNCAKTTIDANLLRLDAALTQAGRAADAQKTGNEIKRLNAEIAERDATINRLMADLVNLQFTALAENMRLRAEIA